MASSRAAFLSAKAPERLRRMTSAFATSPSASSRAFLHCMTDTPVLSRSAFTMSVLISMGVSKCVEYRRSPIDRKPLWEACGNLYAPTLFVCFREFGKDEGDGRVRRVVCDDGKRGIIEIAIRVHDGNDRDPGIFGFFGRMALMARINDEERIGTLCEFRYTAEPFAEP